MDIMYPAHDAMKRTFHFCCSLSKNPYLQCKHEKNNRPRIGNILQDLVGSVKTVKFLKDKERLKTVTNQERLEERLGDMKNKCNVIPRMEGSWNRKMTLMEKLVKYTNRI